MSEILSSAIFHEQMPTNQIRHSRTMLQAIVPGHRAAWIKFGSSEEIADLLKRSAVLKGHTHQAGHYVVEPDQFGGTIRTFEPQKDFCRVLVIMDTEVECALSRDFYFLSDVMAAVGKGESGAHAATTWRSIVKLRGRSVV